MGGQAGGKFLEGRGEKGGDPRSSFNHHHSQVTVPVGPRSLATQPKQKAHLLLVSLNNEPRNLNKWAPARLTLLMASLIKWSDGGRMKMKRGRKWGHEGLEELEVAVPTFLLLWFAVVMLLTAS